MRFSEKLSTIGQIVKWRMNWNRRDLDYRPKDLNSEKFKSARELVATIPDQAVCATSGMGAIGRCSIFFWAIREAFLKNQSPRQLTWISVSAQGGRGKVPGTIEELDPPGLLSSYISGHLETAKSLLRQAEKGNMELHTIPQGELAFLIQQQGQGANTLQSATGIRTFLDPRVGNGSRVSDRAKQQYINPVPDNHELLEYSLPDIQYAMLAAPYADTDGNIYFRDAAAITENLEVTQAAKANGGKVFVAVSGLIEKDDSAISIPANLVDGIVLFPLAEQTACIYQNNHWEALTEGADSNEKASLGKIKFINQVLGIYSKRGPVEDALCRTAGYVFTKVAKKGNLINLGTGLPEEVGRLIYEGGLYDDLTFSCESGVYGGIPAPGVYFGASVNPDRIESSAWMFRHYQEHLDVTVLGFLEVDSQGNVNVSRRGKHATEYVGPGGFSSICESAQNIIFVGSFMAKSEMAIKDGKLTIIKPGVSKFVSQVMEITFSGQEAIKRGKNVFYVTNVGVFKLTPQGLQLTYKVPGIEVEDIRKYSQAKFVHKADEIKTVPSSIMSGDDYRLTWY